jgi:hypothetical protein
MAKPYRCHAVAVNTPAEKLHRYSYLIQNRPAKNLYAAIKHNPCLEIQMELLVFVLDNEEHLEEVLEAYVEAGIAGSTSPCTSACPSWPPSVFSPAFLLPT